MVVSTSAGASEMLYNIETSRQRLPGRTVHYGVRKPAADGIQSSLLCRIHGGFGHLNTNGIEIILCLQEPSGIIVRPTLGFSKALESSLPSGYHLLHRASIPLL